MRITPPRCRRTPITDGDGDRPRLVSTAGGPAEASSKSLAHETRWVSWASPRLRPGQAWGPAPNGSQAPGRCSSLAPASGVELVEGGASRLRARDQLRQAAEGDRAHQDRGVRGYRPPAEDVVAGADARQQPGRGVQPQDLPHVGQGDVGVVVQPSAEVRAAGQLGEAPRTGGDGHLDAGRQGGGPGRRIVAAETGEGADEGREARVARYAGTATSAAASGPR